MASYTKRLYRAAALEKAASSPPAGTRWVVRDVVVASYSATAVQVSVNISGVGVIAIVDLAASPPAKTGHWEGRQVVNAGESLDCTGVVTGVYVLITGYEFVL